SKTDASMRSLNDTMIDCAECGWKFDARSSRDQPNKCDLCTNWSWRFPKNGGSSVFNGVQYTIVNTCSLDSILSIFIGYYGMHWQFLSKKIGTSTWYEWSLRNLLDSGMYVDATKAELIARCYGHLMNIENRTYNLLSSDYETLKELAKSACLINFEIRCKTCNITQSFPKHLFEAPT
ncbi:hypothetical protein PENTCL1PPCAC_21364, partial [Pristionchus entomophagus]